MSRFPASLSACPSRLACATRVALAAAALCAAASAQAHDCFQAAAEYQGVNPLILRAIAWQESHADAAALNRNANGTIDYGLMQINSVHLRRLQTYGISKDKLMEPCANIYIAAWHLRSKMNRYGNSWEAVGAYHSETPSLRDRYARQIIAILQQWRVMPR